MLAIPDLQQRERALTPNESFIIQAPAGSGKTELLIQRLLALLARVQEPEEILAITFTRKAAAEMANRVIDALQRAQNEPEPSHEPARKTWHLAQAVLKQDSRQNWQLIINPHRLRIQTIDSFCASLTRQMPILSQFGAQPTITEDAYTIYREAVRNFMATLDAQETWSEALADVLLHLDNQYNKLETLLIEMLARRDQWLPHIAAIHDPVTLRFKLESELQSIANTTLHLLTSELSTDDQYEIHTLISYACLQLEANDILTAPILCCKQLTGLPSLTADYLKQWQAIACFFLTQKLEWRKTVTIRDGFPSTDKKCSKAENQLRKVMKERYLTLINHFAANGSLLKVLQDITQLPPCSYTESQWQTLTSLLTILRILAGFLWLSFQERNTVDYIEIAQRALQALGDTTDPSQLALQLDYQLKHILVDEFQDTSTIQFRLLEKLTAGWQPNDGKTLFIVGDPMQSIYRFRKAEVGLFIQTEMHGINHLPLTKLTLTTNFRSQQSLVNWFNTAFSKIFPAKANVSTGAIPYCLANGIVTNSTEQPVSLHVYPQNPTEETQEIIRLVKHYSCHDPQARIAILVRARSHLMDIIPALQTAEIKYRAVEIEPLNNKTVIYDLLALTRALLFLDDRVAWLAILRAPWCGLDHGDLYAIAGQNQLIPIWERLHDLESLPLSADGKPRVQRFISIIKPYIEHRSRKPLAYWLESIWLQLGGPASIQNTSELEDARTFFKLIAMQQQGEDIIQIKTLEQKLTELYAEPSEESNINLELMTIHKAKGLEFDVVILPSLQKESNNDSSQLLIFSEQPETDQGLGLILAPIKAFAEQQDPIYRYIQREEKQKADYELCRLLYVAVTRAKRNLHLFGQLQIDLNQNTVKPPAKDSLLGKLWVHISETAYQQLLEQTQIPEISPEQLRSKTRLRRLVNNWQSPLERFMATSSSNPHTANLLHSKLPLDKDVVIDSRHKTTVRENTHENSNPESANKFTLKVEFGEQSSEILYLNRHNTLKHTGTLLHRIFYQLSSMSPSQWPTITKQEKHWCASLMALGVTSHELNFAIELIKTALNKIATDKRCHWILANTHQQAQAELPLTYFDGKQVQQVIIDRTFIDENGIRWIIDYKTTLTKEENLEALQQKYQNQLEKYAKIIQQQDDRPIHLGLYFPLVPAWYEWAYD